MDLNELMKQLNKEFGNTFVSYGIQYPEIQQIPFSSPRLNYMTYGGMPLGRLVEFSGPEGGGKTTTSLDLIKKCTEIIAG